MTPGWIPDRPTKMSKKCQEIIRNPIKNDLWLPSELPQVTPETPNDHQKMPKKWPKNVEIMHAYSSEIFALIVNNPQISIDYQWIIHRSVFLIKKTSKTEKWWKRKRRAPENDSYPSNQFFFNVRKQFKYEKTHDYKICGYLWIINAYSTDIYGLSMKNLKICFLSGWGRVCVMWHLSNPPSPPESHMWGPWIKKNAQGRESRWRHQDQANNQPLHRT